MLNLSELVFKVNTEALVDAADKVAALGKTIDGLSTNFSKLEKNSTQANKAQAKTEKDLAAAEVDRAKAADITAKTEERKAKAIKASTEATDAATSATKSSISILERQQTILEFQTNGYSKGQSSILAYAKAAGVAASEIEEIGKVLQTQRTLMGGDPFDKSLGSLKSLQNEFKTLKEVQRLYTAEIPLTRKQMENLALDKLRLIEAMKIQGRSLGDIKTALKSLNAEYITTAGNINRVVQAENAADKAHKDAASANAYLEKEIQRVKFALQEQNNELNKGTSNALNRFEQNLKRSGLTLNEQRIQMDEYRKSLLMLEKTKAGANTDYITRALGPQITDIFVGLATGQAPLTVMLQQGGQLRDQFALAGVAAADMGKTMRTAARDMVGSVASVAKAFGDLLLGAFIDTGKGIVNIIGRVTGLNDVLEKARYQLTLFAMTDSSFGKPLLALFGMLRVAVIGFAATLAATGVGALIALTVAAVQSVKENDTLAKQMALTGAAMGLTFDAAIAAAQSMESLGVSTGSAIKVIAEMSKQGKFTAEDIALVTKAAVDMNTYGGVAIEDTVKQFAKLKEKPVEAMLELARTTGLVAPEVVKAVMELESQGKTSDATALAIKELAKVNDEQVSRMKETYNGFSLFIIDLGKNISNWYDKVFRNLFRTASPSERIKEEIEKIDAALKGEGLAGVDVKIGISGARERLEIQRTALQNEQAVLEVQANQYEQQQKLKQDKIAMLGIEQSVTDELDKQYLKKSKKKDNLKDFTANFVDEKAKAAAKSKGLDLEAIKSNELLMDSYSKLAKVEWESAQKKPKKDATESYYTKLLKETTNATIKADEANQGLTKSQIRLKELAEDPAFAKFSQKQKDNITNNLKVAASGEVIAEGQALINKLLDKGEGLGKEYYDTLKRLESLKGNAGIDQVELEKSLQALKDTTPAAIKAKAEIKAAGEAYNTYAANAKAALESASVENTKLDFRLSLLGKTTEEQTRLRIENEKTLKLLEAQVKYEKDILAIKNDDRFKSDLIKQSKVLTEREEAYAEERKVINKGVAVAYAEDLDKEVQAVKSGIADSIQAALFEGGKAGSKKIRDVITAALMKPIRVVIDAFVNTAVNSLLEGTTGGSGVGSSSGGVLGSLSAGKSFVDALSGSMNTAITNSFGKFASSSIGQSIGLSNSTAIAGNNPSAFVPAGGQLSSLGTSLQGAMVGAASVAVGLTLNKAISGGYSLGKGMDNFQKAAIVLSEVFGPAGKFIGAIVGAATGLFNRAFGRKLTETGIQGTFGGDAGFQGEGYKYEKGGWFRSNKTTTSELDPGLQNGLAYQFNAIKSSIGFMAVMLGQGTDAISNFTASIKLNFKDLTEEQSTKLLKEEFDKISENLANLALGTTQYNRIGETSVETLTRLHTSLLTANSALSVLDGYLFDVSLAGADASQTLIDLMGGVQQFTNTLSGYYQNFYTEEERTAKATTNLTKEFAKLGITLPEINKSTREWYRTEVEKLGAMDLSIESNAKAYASILSLQSAVNDLAPAFDTTKEEVNKFLEGILSTTSDLEIELLQAQGKESEALNLRRQIETKGFNAAEIAAYDYNARLRESITATNAASAALKAYKTAAASIATSKDTIAGVVRSPVEVAQNNLNRTLLELNNLLKPANVVKDDYTYLTKYADVMAAFIAETAPGGPRSGESETDYANEHYRRSGQGEGRMSPQELLDLVTTLVPNFTPLSLEDVLGIDLSNQGAFSAEAWAAIAEVFSAKASLVTAGTSTTTTPETPVTVVDTTGLDLAKVLQSYNRALLEAQGNTAGLAKFDKAISDAALIAEGWTQVQIDAVDAAREVTKIANATKDFNRALLEAQGNTSGLAAFDKAISDAALLTQGWTQLQIDAVDAAREESKAKDTYRNNLQNAFNALSRSVSAQKAIVQKQVETYSESVKNLSELFNILGSSIKELYGTVDSTNAMQYKAGRDFIRNSAVTAVAGGGLPSSIDLQNALGAVKAGNVIFASKFEKDFAALTLASDLDLMEKLTKNQLSEAERLLLASQKELETLDSILAKAQQQLDTAIAQLDATSVLNDSVLSVADALNNFASVLASSKPKDVIPERPYLNVDVFPKPPATSLPTYTGGSSTGGNSGLEGYTSVGGGLYQVGNEVADAATIAQLIAISSGMPKFATGINNVPYDMTARIHEGEAIIPKQFNPFNPNASMQGMSNSSETLQELRALKEEFQMLRVEARATAISTSKINNNLERSIVPTQDGDALLVKTTT